MERYLCIHGHFYQPPRENPWLEAVEIQDSAHPYHDWNGRITAECYAPNSASRVLDGEGRITGIVSNYSRISFNFGPTLLSWLEYNSPEIYNAILEADKQSIEWRSGHGSAIAQTYNHVIMPLANSRDKRTQIIWGIKDFERRFMRFPEGLWLPETAVDLETLDMLAEYGIKFTILAPYQASRVRRTGTGKWKDLSGGRIDPTMVYLCRLPSGRSINLFFYDGPISRAVAFESLLANGNDFANRLMSGFSDTRQWPQLMHIATDGETYGHHQKFGDMALTYALNYVESNGLARLTNYGEYLEKHPPTHEVQIFENTAWSCMHGIERWKGNCGCNSGGHAEWNQEWRGPLRDAFDWLRDHILPKYERVAGKYLKDPWKARDEYINFVLDRRDAKVDQFFEANAVRNLSKEERVAVLKLLEMQRHAMLMYTSCGWFFDEISGIETVQVLQYAGRTVQLADDIFKDSIENSLKIRLAKAKSNIPEHLNGAVIYNKFIKPAMIDFKKVAAHYAVRSIFEEYREDAEVYSYEVTKRDYQTLEAGIAKLAVGMVSVRSKTTEEDEDISFCVLYLGSHALNGGVRSFQGNDLYKAMKEDMISAFETGAFVDIVRLMDKHFGMNNYSLIHLFRDEQRKILNHLISKTLEDVTDAYRAIYDKVRALVGFLKEMGMPVPVAFMTAAEFDLNHNLKNAVSSGSINTDRIQEIAGDIKKWDLNMDVVNIEIAARRRFEDIMQRLYENPSDLGLLDDIRLLLELFKQLPFEINYWQSQNIYYKTAKAVYSDFFKRSMAGDADAAGWTALFKYIGDMLFFNTSAIIEE